MKKIKKTEPVKNLKHGKISKTELVKNLKNDKISKIKFSKDETIIISEIKPNEWGTRFTIEVDHYETGKDYSCYWYSVGGYSRPEVIDAIVKELKKRRLLY